MLFLVFFLHLSNMLCGGKRKRTKTKEEEEAFPTKEFKQRGSVLSRYTADLARLYNKGLSPAEIASQLRLDHSLGEDVNGKSVSDHIDYIRLNGLAKLTPPNDPSIKRPEKCLFYFSISV